MNAWDFVLGIAVIVLLVLAVWLTVRSRAKGGCAVCPHAKTCNELQNELQACPAAHLGTGSTIEKPSSPL